MRNMRTKLLLLTIYTVFCIFSIYSMFSLPVSVRTLHFHTDELRYIKGISVRSLIFWFLLSANVSGWVPFDFDYVRDIWSNCIQQVKLCFLVLNSFITSGIRQPTIIRKWGYMLKMATVPCAIMFSI